MFMKLYYVLCVTFVLYVCGCYCEILTKNVAPNPQYSEYNILVKMVGYENSEVAE